MLEHVDKNTILVACMMVNNEVGTRNYVDLVAADSQRVDVRQLDGHTHPPGQAMTEKNLHGHVVKIFISLIRMHHFASHMRTRMYSVCTVISLRNRFLTSHICCFTRIITHGRCLDKSNFAL